MEQPDKKLNLQISKYYAEHACQLSSTNEVAILLDLPASRVSELRHGRRQLTVAEAEKIKETYGWPSASKGHWMECEHLSSENIHKQFIDNGLALHYLQIIEMVKSEQLQNSLFEYFYFSDQTVSGYQSMSGLNGDDYSEVQKENNKLFRTYKLKYFNELLAKNRFHDFCDRESASFSPEAFNAICAEINPNFGFHSHPDLYEHLFRLFRALRDVRDLSLSGTYANLVQFETGLSIGGYCKIDKAVSPRREYVVVGKVVWELGSENPLRLTNPIANAGVGDLQADDDCLNFSRSLNPKTFTHCSLKLYYSELYKYFLQVNLFEDGDGFEPARKVLVEISERQKIFEELVDLFNYFQIETGWALKQIKYAVAQNGGYIPGAIYLD
jgi:hypothetical protein